MTDTTQATLRQQFEAAYVAAYPTSSMLDPAQFYREDDGQYERVQVQTAWTLYCAALAAQAVPAGYGSTALPYEMPCVALTNGDRRLMRFIIDTFGNGHAAYDDLESVITAARTGRASPAPATDIDEAALARMTEQGAKAWSGVDAQSLRDGSYAPAEAKEEPDMRTPDQMPTIQSSLKHGVSLIGEILSYHGDDIGPSLSEQCRIFLELSDEALSTPQPQAAQPVALVEMLEETRDTLAKVLIKVRRDAPDLSGKLLGHADAVIARADAILDHIDTAALAQPVGYMSPKQIPRIVDPDDASGTYIPIRRTPKGNFTLALYTAAPALTEEQERDKKDAQRYRRCRRILAWQLNPNRVATSDEVDAYVDSAQLPSDPDAALRSTQSQENENG